MPKVQDQEQNKQQLPDEVEAKAEVERTPPAADETLVEEELPAAGEVVQAAQAALETRLELRESRPWKPGSIIAGLYRVEEELQGGAMGMIHRIHHLQWGVDLVVKTPNERTLQASGGRERFQQREAYEWIQLGLHPNVATCFYVRTLDDGIPRIFVEYVDGGTLADWIEEGRVTNPVTALHIWVQICWGLGWAHKRGLVHRDIKPANILMTAEGTPKVTDFGLVKSASEAGEQMRVETKSESPPGTTAWGGTPGYAAPEQLKSGVPITPAADVYALGVVLYDLLQATMRLPTFFEAYPRARPALYQSYLKTRKHPLAEVLLRCMAYKPEDRYPDAAALAEALMNTYIALTGKPYPHRAPDEVQLRADGLNNRALSLLDLEREEEALECWQQALQGDPHHLAATFNYGYWRWGAGQVASEFLLLQMRDLESSHETNPDYRRCLAWIHLERGDIEVVEKIWQDVEGAAQVLGEGFEVAFRSADRPVARFLRAFEGRAGEVRSLCFSPDGRYVLSGSGDTTLRLWEVESGQRLHTFRGHTAKVHSVCFSPDGRYALSGGEDGTLRLWDISASLDASIASGQEVREFEGHTGGVLSVCFSPDGRYALSGGEDNVLRLWDILALRHSLLPGSQDNASLNAGVESGWELLRFEGHTESIHSVCFSPDGRYALSGSGDKTLRLWDISALRHSSMLGSQDSASLKAGLESEQEVRKFEGHTASVLSACFSPDGRYVLSGGWDRTLRLWDVKSGRELRTLEGHTGEVYSVCFSPDGRYALSGGWDKTLWLWDMSASLNTGVERGRALRKFEGHTDCVFSVCFSPDGRYALSGSKDETLRLWEVHFPGEKWGSAHPYPLLSQLRDVASLGLEQRRADKYLEEARGFMERGAYREVYRVLRERQTISGYEKDSLTQRLLTQCGMKGRRLGLKAAWRLRTFRGHTLDVNTVCFSPDGRYALSGSEDKTLRLWEVESGQEVRKFEGHTGGVLSACFSPDGRYVLSGSEDKTLRLWDISALRHSPLPGSQDNASLETGVESRQEVHKFEGHTGSVFSVCFSPDGRYALSGSADETLRLWDISASLEAGVESGQEVCKFEGHTGSVLSVCFSPDGRYALSGGEDRTLWLWDIASRQGAAISADCTFSVRFSPNGRYALSGGRDNALWLWDIENRGALRTFEGHTDCVFSVCFSPDGRYALSGGEDKTLRLWEIESGRELHKFWGHTEGVLSACFSPDGRYVLSGSGDKTLRLWEVDWEWEFPEATDWDEGVEPYFAIFLTLHTPYGPDGLRRAGTPTWTREDFQQLLAELDYRGYGWLRPEGLRREPGMMKGYAHNLIERGAYREAYSALREIQAMSGYEKDSQVQELLTKCGTKGRRTGLNGAWYLGAFKGHTLDVNAVCFSPDGRYALSGGEDKTLRLWDISVLLNARVESGWALRTFEGHIRSVHSVCFSPDGCYALSGGEDKTLRLWDISASLNARVKSGQEVRAFERHTGSVHSVCFSPDGRYALSGSRDKTLRLWEIESGRELRKFEGHTGGVLSVCFSPDGRYALSGGEDETLRLWDIASGQEAGTFEGHTGGVLSVCFSPDGRYALSGGEDEILRLWDISASLNASVESGRELHKFWWHADEIHSVCFSPDGRYALSGDKGGTLRLGEVESGRELWGRVSEARSVCFSPDGRYVLSGNRDKTLGLWWLDWKWEFPKTADWDEGARPYLEIFLTLHTPRGGFLQRLFQRASNPPWTEENFQRLLTELGYRGYGWLRPEGVGQELEEMARDQQGPPPLGD